MRTFWFRVSGLEFRVSGFGLSPKTDLALFGELDAIGQKVEENLTKPVRIPDHVLEEESQILSD